MDANLKLTTEQQAAYKLHRAALQEQVSTFTTMKEKAGADSEFATELQTLIDTANAQLSKLPPLEQIPAAMELASAVNWFLGAWENAQEYAKRIFERLKDANTRLGAAVSEVNAFKKQVTDGDLLTKAVHIEKLTAEKNAGIIAGREEIMPEVIQFRKALIETNKWPMPAEDVLKKSTAEFNAAIEAAKANIAHAKTKKIELNGRGHKALTMNLWKPATEFNTAIEQVESMLPGAPAKPKANLGLGGDTTEQDEAPVTSEKKSGLFPI